MARAPCVGGKSLSEDEGSGARHGVWQWKRLIRGGIDSGGVRLERREPDVGVLGIELVVKSG
jgi:hypothetical protein